MKRLLILFFSLFIVFGVSAQELEKQRLVELDTEIAKAVEEGNYEKAALLKKEKELTQELVVALEEGDLAKAKNVKYKISQLDSEYDPITVLERELDEAIAAEDYDKAAEIKKQIAELKNQGSGKNTVGGKSIDENNFSEDNPMFERTNFAHFSVGRVIFLGVVDGVAANAVTGGFSLGFYGGGRKLFGNGRMYRPGLDFVGGFELQLTPKFKYQSSGGEEKVPLIIAASIGTGLGNVFSFKNNIGVEVNFYINFRTQIVSAGDVATSLGVNFNPVFKFKYKWFYVGFQTGYSSLRTFVSDSDIRVGLRERYYNFIIGGTQFPRKKKR